MFGATNNVQTKNVLILKSLKLKKPSLTYPLVEELWTHDPGPAKVSMPAAGCRGQFLV